MKKIIYFCFAMMAMLTMASCDKDADNVKLVTISSTYSDSLLAALCLPDYDVEQQSMLWNNNGLPCVAADTVPNSKVHLYFINDQMATIDMSDLKDMTFRIPYLLYYNDPGEGLRYAGLRGVYSHGAFAKIYNIVSAHNKPSEINDDEFYKFAAKIEYLEDTISFANIKTQPLVLKKTGAIFSTFDFEQNSFYEKVYLGAFTYERKTNLLPVMEYIEQHFMQYFTEEEKAVCMSVKSSIENNMKGTITDASGWCIMGYANYCSYIGMTIHKATGIIDVLTNALYGPYKVVLGPELDYVVAKDENGNPIPHSLCLELEFDGTDIISFDKQEDK